MRGRRGRRYRLLLHEAWVARRRPWLFRRLSVRVDPAAPATVLLVAALTDLGVFLILALALACFAVVMYWLTVANGGPLSTPGAPLTPLEILVAIGFWGLVLVALVSLVAATMRFVQCAREARIGSA